MRDDGTTAPSWQTPLIIAIAVIFVILAALILTQIDNVQRRSLLPPKRLTIIDQEGTIIASEPGNVYLPGNDVVTATPSATPQQSNLPTLTNTPEVPAVPMLKATCEGEREGWAPYIVQRTDTLSSLAFKFGVSKESIAQVNCLAFEKLIWGQMIYLPQVQVNRADEVQCGVPPNWIHYVVHPGDTLLMLAEEYNSTVYAIMNANCLESTHLSAGRKLFLPPIKPTLLSPTRIAPTSTRPSPRITATPTQTRMFLPTFTPSPSPFPSETATPTEIFETPTLGPTQTLQPTATHTATPLPPSPTATIEVPTNTPTPTPSVTPTNSATPITPTPTFTATPPLPTPTNTSAPPSPTPSSTPIIATSTATVSVHPPLQPTSTSTPDTYP